MGFVTRMSFCTCGKTAETFGGLCSRCGALQSLGLGADASAADVEDAYRTLVKVWHPDRFQNDLKLKIAADEKLKEINAAHDYLIAEHPTRESFTAAPEPEPTRAKRERPADVPDFVSEATGSPEPPAPRRYAILAGLLLRALIAAGVVAAMALMWLSADSLLLSNPQTAGIWGEYKGQVSLELHSVWIRMWTEAKEKLHTARTRDAVPAPVPPAEGDRTAGLEKHSEPSVQVKPSERLSKAQPYVTSGLTPLEVLAILGKPTSSSGAKMCYGGSEIDFRDGEVTGWKIDGKSPIRVKLWPNRPPVPGMTTFGVGSSKSDVIELQGTPSLFSDNEFGYGGSMVFFDNEHVVSWKEDPASVQLRVPH